MHGIHLEYTLGFLPRACLLELGPEVLIAGHVINRIIVEKDKFMKPECGDDVKWASLHVAIQNVVRPSFLDR